MTPTEIRATRITLGLTQAELAALLRVSRDTILRAERDGRMIPALEAAYLMLDRFGAEAIATLTPGVNP